MTPESYQRVTRDLLSYSVKQKWLKIFGLVVVGIVVLMVLLSGGDFTGSAFGRQLPTLMVMAVVWLGIIYFMPKMLLSKQPYPEAHPLRYTFSESGVQIATANSASTIQWAGYLKAEETEEWLLLFQGKTIANPVLKSALSSSDLERLRGLLRAKGLMKSLK